MITKNETIIKVLKMMVNKISSHENSWSQGYKTGLEHAICVLEDKPIPKPQTSHNNDFKKLSYIKCKTDGCMREVKKGDYCSICRGL